LPSWPKSKLLIEDNTSIDASWFLVQSSGILVTELILVLVLIRFQKHNFSFNSVLVRKIVLVLVLVNDWQ